MRVVLLGGDTNPEIPCTYGPVTLNEIRRYRADVTLISPVGINAHDGVTFGNEQEASLATAMAEQSSSLLVLADYSKIGLRSRYAVTRPPAQQTLVTNIHAANAPALAALSAQGLDVVTV